MRALAWCGVIAPLLRLGLILVLGSLHPGYSQPRDFISELGAQGAPFALAMNAGISLGGLLVTLFSVALYRACNSSPLALGGAALLALSGLAFIAVGLFPCDPGCSLRAPSPVMRVHLLAGMIAMTTQSAAPLALGLRFVTDSRRRSYALVSLACGIVAAGALLLLFGQGSRLSFPGFVQKLVQAATGLWVLVSGAYVLQRLEAAQQPVGA